MYMRNENVRTEAFQVSGEQLLSQIEELSHRDRVRRITIQDDRGKTLLAMPLTRGMTRAVLLAARTALRALSPMMSRLTLIVEEREE
jgi:hypothetical protein